MILNLETKISSIIIFNLYIYINIKKTILGNYQHKYSKNYRHIRKREIIAKLMLLKTKI